MWVSFCHKNDKKTSYWDRLFGQKRPSVDFSRHFVRENKQTEEKRMIEMQDYLLQTNNFK
jgi:hypothetical protein